MWVGSIKGQHQQQKIKLDELKFSVGCLVEEYPQLKNLYDSNMNLVLYANEHCRTLTLDNFHVMYGHLVFVQ